MKDLLLLPGWGFDRRVWQPLLPALAKRFRIHADAAALPPGGIVCGWSLGALRALRLALDQPARATRLVLVGATPRFIQAADWPDAQPAELLDGFAAAVAADPAAALRRFAALLNRGDSDARRLTRHLHDLLAEGIPDAATLAAGLGELRDADLRPALPAVRQPVLVLHGEHDALMPLAAARWLATHLPAGRLETFAGAAHAPFLARPERFLALLTAFADA
jgi:pimeloyl-[acyl-carrier protein] methyl ester esterase